MPLRESLLVIENDMVILREPIGEGSSSYCRLRLVPESLRTIVFVAFHANPIGGHMNYVRTFRAIRLRYFWPGMFQFIKDLCLKCPGCALSNRTHRPKSALVYSFPITSPMMVIHVDGYDAGAHSSFEGDKTYVVAVCGMTTFAVMEPVRSKDAKGFAAALMRILLRFGICHTIVLDKASTFRSVFEKVVELLQLNSHTISSENHNAMLVERVLRFVNKCLKILTNERDSVRIALEAILLSLYAWNSAPVIGTDMSRSLLVTGRAFSFPVDFSAARHLDLVSTPNDVENYARDQAALLAACRDIYRVLLGEHRAWHREYINENRPHPRIYQIGDIVFARRSTRSNAKSERVGKLMYPMTGPWRIVERLSGASYRIEHCLSPNRFDKKHASDLSPYPLELVPFQPVDGCDNRFSQIWRPIGKNPFAEAGLQGFDPSPPFRLPAHLADVHSEFEWPSVGELNDELQPFPWLSGEMESLPPDSEPYVADPVMYTGPPPEPLSVSPVIPSISDLVAAIIRSTDRLFFISHATSEPHREWRLVRVVFRDSVSLRPSCLQDGRFLVEFFVRHTADGRYNSANQRFWLQYHMPGDIASPLDTTETHLIRPSDTSEQLAARKGLIALRQWVNLTHESVFLHGPFEFASISGRKTRDRVSTDDWKVLDGLKSQYDNPAPTFDLPSYSVHVDRGVHCTFHCPSICTQLRAAAVYSQTTGDCLYPTKGHDTSQTP
jgi:hypothetical protein